MRRSVCGPHNIDLSPQPECSRTGSSPYAVVKWPCRDSVKTMYKHCISSFHLFFSPLQTPSNWVIKHHLCNVNPTSGTKCVTHDQHNKNNHHVPYIFQNEHYLFFISCAYTNKTIKI